MEIITKSVRETQKIAEILAQKILKSNKIDKSLIIALEGDLGSGKTTFIQGFAKGLGIKEKVLSPTFVILKRFKIRENLCSNSCKLENLYHIDCYRIIKPKEILDLGFKELLKDYQNIVIIEWAERVKKILPRKRINIKFEWVDEKSRLIKIKA